MSFFDIFVLALALSVDAAVVSFSYGLIITKNRLKTALMLAFFTGFGQFVMPIIGWLGTSSVSRYISHFDHWISFLVFLLLGLNVIHGALRENGEEKLDKTLGLKTAFMIGVATSIDACAAGVTLYFIKTPILTAAAVIGLVSFVNSIAAFNSCGCLRKIPTKYIEIFSGVVLILLGVKVLFEHLSGLQ